MNCQEIVENNIIERYLRRELREPQRDEFELHYFACEECFQQLETVRALQPVIARMPQGRGRRAAWWWGVGVLAAAAGLALVLIRPGMKMEAPSRPPAQETALLRVSEAEAPVYEKQVFRGGPAGQEGFDAAMDLYQRRDYAGAAQALRAVTQRDPALAAAWHYLAASLLMEGKAPEASAAFDRVIAMGRRSPYEEEARFGRAQALLMAGHAADARKELQRVVELRGDYEAKARKLLERK